MPSEIVDLLAVVPAAVAWALVGLTVWPGRRGRVQAAAAFAGALSLATTAMVLGFGPRYRTGVTPVAVLAMVEAAALAVLVAFTVRATYAPGAAVAGGLAGAAVPCLLVRFSGAGPVLVAGFAAWTLPVVLAAAVGWYLRSADSRRATAVAAARRAQRLELAGDLHDFVAHDISEILAQAQAGQVLAEHDSIAAVGTLGVIEQAALRALAAMDRTVAMLHEDGTGHAPPYALDDLAELTTRFGAKLDLEEDLDLPRELAATAYRVVAEGLTNVRRHAPGASQVEVTVRRVGNAVEVLVADDGGTVSRQQSPRGGLGLPGLQERLGMLGGTLTAGPRPSRGWRLVAVLPLAEPVA